MQSQKVRNAKALARIVRSTRRRLAGGFCTRATAMRHIATAARRAVAMGCDRELAREVGR